MKFTKEEAFESLKGVLTNDGKKTLRMSERSLKEQSEDLIKLIANDDMELQDFVEKVSPLLSSTNSNVEKDASDRFKEQIKQWEKDHPAPQANPEPPKEEPKGDDVMSKMMKRLEELENREKAREKEISMAQKRKDLLKAMKEKGIKDEQWSKDFVAEISMTDDFDIDSKADAYLKLYNKSQAATAGDGDATPRSSSPNTSGREAHRFDYIKKEYERESEKRKDVI